MYIACVIRKSLQGVDRGTKRYCERFNNFYDAKKYAEWENHRAVAIGEQAEYTVVDYSEEVMKLPKRICYENVKWLL